MCRSSLFGMEKDRDVRPRTYLTLFFVCTVSRRKAEGMFGYD